MLNWANTTLAESINWPLFDSLQKHCNVSYYLVIFIAIHFVLVAVFLLSLSCKLNETLCERHANSTFILCWWPSSDCNFPNSLPFSFSTSNYHAFVEHAFYVCSHYQKKNKNCFSPFIANNMEVSVQVPGISAKSYNQIMFNVIIWFVVLGINGIENGGLLITRCNRSRLKY